VIETRIGVPGITRLWAALPEARIAGGAVRDTLLGQPVRDVDFASPLSPEAVIERLSAAKIKTVPTGLAHGTITAIIGGRSFEITSLRRDIETDGRHAVIALTDNWKEDAARRDFTINAMSMTRDGAVFDYFDGQADLLAGRVRFVGEARPRITEDYLRILRFFRFFARYAKGEPDPDALAAIIQCRNGITTLSAERIWSELKQILAAPDPGGAIAWMQASGVLPLILPEGVNLSAFNRLLSYDAPADPLMRISALYAGDIQKLGLRLKLSVNELVKLFVYRMPNKLSPASTKVHLRRALAEDSAEFLISKTWLAQTDEPGWPALRDRIAATPRPVFPLQGRDIVALGIPAGPRIGEILSRTRRWWKFQGCTADFETCLEIAKLFANTKRRMGRTQ
jgi:poly(A) polymerase/tRNA nucleotidyltransferase (CCA-adding enzyme)